MMSDDDAGDDGGVDAHAEGDGDLASLCSGQDTSFVGSWAWCHMTIILLILIMIKRV